MLQSTSLKIHSIFGSPVRMILLTILMSISVFSAPLSLKNTPYYSPSTSVSIVIFYTSWCPPCKRSLSLLDEMKRTHPKLKIHRINVDDLQSQKKALPYGLFESVPLILIADNNGNVVKRFQAIPDKIILNALIQRLEEGRLENGTLPIEQRIDSWKQNRKGI